MAAQHDASDLAQRVLESVARQLVSFGNETSSSSSYGLGDPANATVTEDGSNEEFDRSVFWGVNCFLLFMLTMMIVWCCCCKKDWLLNPEQRRQQSDAEFQRRLRRRMDQYRQSKVDTPAQRRQKLLQSFERHGVTMVVKEEDLLDDNILSQTKEVENQTDSGSSSATDETETGDIETGNADKDADVDSENGDNDESNKENAGDDDDADSSCRQMSVSDSINASGYLKLPESSGRPPVPNCCAVCLGEYDVGDPVVWSSNPSCAHAFHEECIVEWLIKMQPETPCPCCRQEFTDLETVRQQKKIIWAGDAFNLGGITL